MTGAVVWAVLAALIALSACFSASETALFSLGTADRDRAGVRVRRLLAHPRDLLVTILLANLVVNLLYFAFARRLEAGTGEYAELYVGAGALIALIVLGDIIPKTLALRAPLSVARASALPLALIVPVLAPLRRSVGALLELFFRAAGEAAREERVMTPDTLAHVLEKSAETGLLEVGEADLLAEILELESIRVREIMTPRVDMLALDLKAQHRAEVVRLACERRIAWVPVLDGGADHVVGRVRVRDLLTQPDRPVEELAMPVKFVPEVASALELLNDLRRDRTEEAVVVDEWGGTAGVVTIEEIFEEIVGDLRVEGEQRRPPVLTLGGGRFRVAGDLSIRDWNEQFGHQVVPNEFETVGGLVAALLGRIPRAGDRVRVGELAMEVREVRGRRVLAVDMEVSEQREGAA